MAGVGGGGAFCARPLGPAVPSHTPAHARKARVLLVIAGSLHPKVPLIVAASASDNARQTTAPLRAAALAVHAFRPAGYRAFNSWYSWPTKRSAVAGVAPVTCASNS